MLLNKYHVWATVVKMPQLTSPSLRLEPSEWLRLPYAQASKYSTGLSRLRM